MVKEIRSQFEPRFQLLDESVFELVDEDNQDQHLNKIREFCTKFLTALDETP